MHAVFGVSNLSMITCFTRNHLPGHHICGTNIKGEIKKKVNLTSLKQIFTLKTRTSLNSYGWFCRESLVVWGCEYLTNTSTLLICKACLHWKLE